MAKARNPRTGFQIADVVTLRSGGQPMTIEGLEATLAICVWHDVDGRGNAAKYQVTSLVLVK